MRVLFITGEFPPMQGGVGDCTNEIAKALGACGVEVQVLTSTRAVGGPPSAVQVLPMMPHWGWSSLRILREVCRAYQPHIVHLQYQTGAFGMHPAINFLPRYFRGRPGDAGRAPCIVTTFHDLRVPYLFPKAGPVRDWVTRTLAESCDAVIATNDEDYARLATWTLKLLTLIPIGSNIAATLPADYDRNAWRAKLGVAENETLLCYFGFLNESKGGETLVRALAQMPQAKLLMLGGQTGASDPTNVAYLAKIKSLISNLQLTNRVLWTDHVAPAMVSAHFRACDVCVLPYRDGASYRRGTLMAALAHGCAIVTTVVNGRASVVSKLPPLRDGANCVLIPPDAPPAIVSAVQRLMASRELRERIGAGAQKLAAHFTWDKIAQQHLELYERIAN
jgi:glycosyltransferase involved in cell wall biosynthesis